MHSPLITRFLVIVAGCVAGVLVLAFAFVFLSTWVQRLLKVLLKDPSSSNHC